jgi:glycosyltransferase involved in cell wall biosynthesis
LYERFREQNVRIAYVYHLHADSPGVQSGRPFAILKGLRKSGVTVLPVFPLHHTRWFFPVAAKFVAKLRGSSYLSDRVPGFLQNCGREASRKLSGREFDVVFSPSTLPLCYLQTTKPISFCADATFDSMVDYYPDYTRLSRAQREFSEAAERSVLLRASLLVYPSEWAAQSAIHHYGVARARVAVLPWGANFGAENRREHAVRWIEARRPDEIRLLFVGKQWKRKGGDIAFETMRILRDSGWRVSLDIVGCIPPAKVCADKDTRIYGQLSFVDEEQCTTLRDLFARAHFVLVPSRAEAFGIIFCEANAFAVPAVATNTGGIPSIIRNGINGHMLPLDADASEYAAVIANSANDHTHYRQLAETSFDEFRRRLNWDTWIESYLRIAEAVIIKHSASAKA